MHKGEQEASEGGRLDRRTLLGAATAGAAAAALGGPAAAVGEERRAGLQRGRRPGSGRSRGSRR